ncbi:MAG: anion permease [Deltaproteobacteria bacterium]|nr:anion permease [Deltaproteobacteria bacterium]
MSLHGAHGVGLCELETGVVKLFTHVRVYFFCEGGFPIEPVSLLLLGAGLYVGWNIGANDTANCIGTTLGCGLIPFRIAVLLVALFATLGAFLQGAGVMETIGRGIIRSALHPTALLVALICSGFFVTLATFLKIPTSTSQAVVGAIAGIGFATHSEVNIHTFVVILESWFFCPVLVLVLAFMSMYLMRIFLREYGKKSLLFQHVLGWLTIFSACYVAYSLGADNAGNAMGLVSRLDSFNTRLLLLLGGLSIALGALTYGKKVSDTVGKGITSLDVPGAFVAQVSSALGVHFFSMLGIPVSTSSAIVSAVVGVGLVKGGRNISKKTIFIIVSGWILTPAFALAFSFLMYKTVWLVF